MISARFLLPLIIGLLLAAVPTVRHGYFTFQADAPGITDAALPSTVAGIPGAPRVRQAAWVRNAYGADSWAERAYESPGRAITLFVARGFDMKKLYHHPELGVLRGRSFQPLHHATLPGGAGEPVYVLPAAEARGESAVYALVYESRWVANPYVLQLSSALSTLWTGRRPLTLVLASGTVLTDQGQPSRDVADLLRAAVRGLAGKPPSPS